MQDLLGFVYPDRFKVTRWSAFATHNCFPDHTNYDAKSSLTARHFYTPSHVSKRVPYPARDLYRSAAVGLGPNWGTPAQPEQ